MDGAVAAIFTNFDCRLHITNWVLPTHCSSDKLKEGTDLLGPNPGHVTKLGSYIESIKNKTGGT